MNDIRKANGIPNCKNGDHKYIQKQIDLMHEDVIVIRKTIEKFGPMAAKNEERSSTNFKLICVIFAAIIGVAIKIFFIG